MSTFLQAAAVVLISVVLIMVLKIQGKDIGLLLSIFVCCALGCAAMFYLRPVIEFIDRLQTMGTIDQEMLSILLKVVGIALISEIAALVCGDAGNSAMGKSLQFLAVAVILYLSLPMLNALLKLVESVLENV